MLHRVEALGEVFDARMEARQLRKQVQQCQQQKDGTTDGSRQRGRTSACRNMACALMMAMAVPFATLLTTELVLSPYES